MKPVWPENAKFGFGQYVRKIRGAEWEGKICGWYRTELTEIGYAIKSLKHKGSVQIFPETAIELAPYPSI